VTHYHISIHDSLTGELRHEHSHTIFRSGEHADRVALDAARTMATQMRLIPSRTVAIVEECSGSRTVLWNDEEGHERRRTVSVVECHRALNFKAADTGIGYDSA
jgi:hypothetical protein